MDEETPSVLSSAYQQHCILYSYITKNKIMLFSMLYQSIPTCDVGKLDRGQMTSLRQQKSSIFGLLSKTWPGLIPVNRAGFEDLCWGLFAYGRPTNHQYFVNIITSMSLSKNCFLISAQWVFLVCIYLMWLLGKWAESYLSEFWGYWSPVK